jgi:hypothetical protein
MNVDQHLRGRFTGLAASLVYVLPNEIVKWQYPLNAAAEKTVPLGNWFALILQFSARVTRR